MEEFFRRLIYRAASIDELLSDAFQPVAGQKADADLAASRLAAWCRSSTSGDWRLFNQRLERDGLRLADVLSRLATVKRSTKLPFPKWWHDAVWVEAALRASCSEMLTEGQQREAIAFEDLLAPLVQRAHCILLADTERDVSDNLSANAVADLLHSFLGKLSDTLAAALYQRFDQTRDVRSKVPESHPDPRSSRTEYDQFVRAMRAGGFRQLFEAKPELLRLIATVTREWIDTSRDLVTRLSVDIEEIRRTFGNCDLSGKIDEITDSLSDPHNGGYSVLILRFEDGSRVVYKPKDLRVDVAWHSLIARLNGSSPPVDLKAVRAIARSNYGWTEFIEHRGCEHEEGPGRYFRRAGAWLALFHCFAASDMHEENLVAFGDHPTPIDMEVLLQATPEEQYTGGREAKAFEAAMAAIDNSVMTTGLLPTYRRSPANNVFVMGGLVSGWDMRVCSPWADINSDRMRPLNPKGSGVSNPNLPHVNGRYHELHEHIDDFVSGFEDYASFIALTSKGPDQGGLFGGFCGLPVRKMIRPTAFYYFLLERIKSIRAMGDGASWSAQADFLSRFSDWDKVTDPYWPLQAAERAALLNLNYPYFTTLSDGNEIRDGKGISVRAIGVSGLSRARARVRCLTQSDIAWQSNVIRLNTAVLSRPAIPISAPQQHAQISQAVLLRVPRPGTFRAEADEIAADLTRSAIRAETAAAWIGLDSLGDTDSAQLVPLGPDLYGGHSGVGVFLAAHYKVTGNKESKELAIAAVGHLRGILNGSTGARMARSLGTGGAIGLGSLVYGLAVMAKLLNDDDLLHDAHVAGNLFSDDLISADQRLDVFGGNAGGILALLRLHRDSPSDDLLFRATQCGRHLIAHPFSEGGKGCWLGQGNGPKSLNGMSHGAAGFAYALASLAAATGRDDFQQAALHCINFENASFDAVRGSWPDFRSSGEATRACSWCHGAAGVGIARAATIKCGHLDLEMLASDVEKALVAVDDDWPGQVDTLCDGALGGIEFLCEAADVLSRDSLRVLAEQRMATVIDRASAGDGYRWNLGTRQFNLGLFRGLAGVGYTALRRLDRTLPNVLRLE